MAKWCNARGAIPSCHVARDQQPFITLTRHPDTPVRVSGEASLLGSHTRTHEHKTLSSRRPAEQVSLAAMKRIRVPYALTAANARACDTAVMPKRNSLLHAHSKPSVAAQPKRRTLQGTCLHKSSTAPSRPKGLSASTANPQLAPAPAPPLRHKQRSPKPTRPRCEGCLCS